VRRRPELDGAGAGEQHGREENEQREPDLPRALLGEDPLESERRQGAERRLREEERALGVADVQAGDARARAQQRTGEREREAGRRQQGEAGRGAAPPAEESEGGEQQRDRSEREGDLEEVVARTGERGVDEREAEESLVTRRPLLRLRG